MSKIVVTGKTFVRAYEASVEDHVEYLIEQFGDEWDGVSVEIDGEMYENDPIGWTRI